MREAASVAASPQEKISGKNINCGKVAKRPQSLTRDARRASRGRNRWYVGGKFGQSANDNWSASIRLNAFRYCHATVAISFFSFITILLSLAHLTLPKQSLPRRQNSIIAPPRGYTTAA
jgi:hypothetical protein